MNEQLPEITMFTLHGKLVIHQAIIFITLKFELSFFLLFGLVIGLVISIVITAYGLRATAYGLRVTSYGLAEY